VQVTLARHQAHSCRLAGVVAAFNLDHAKLNIVDGDRSVRLLIEALQRSDAQTCLVGATGDAEVLAAAGNGDVVGGLDLTQVLVECAAQIGEARIIDRLKIDFQTARTGAGHLSSMLLI
jgi:hypothetical protein